ncbi:MAG: VCBS repeat-containing protein, partial [Planctomycetota bacterium]
MNARQLTTCFLLLPLAACGEPERAGHSAGHERMVATLAQLAKDAARDHPYFGKARLEHLQQQVERAGERAEWRLLLEAATEHLHHGHEREAIALLQRAHDGLASGKLTGDDAAKVGVAFHLGVAWLRLAETENCCARPTADSCIVPIQGGGLHTVTDGAEHARELFAEVLSRTGEHDYWHHAARWLFNLAYMTLGEWPDGVPAQHRLPKEAFADETGFPRFRAVSAQVGLDTEGTAGGVVVEDFDGDEWLDVMVSDWSTDGQLHYYHHDGNGSFAERSSTAGLDGISGGLNLVGADYDND